MAKPTFTKHPVFRDARENTQTQELLFSTLFHWSIFLLSVYFNRLIYQQVTAPQITLAERKYTGISIAHMA